MALAQDADVYMSQTSLSEVEQANSGLEFTPEEWYLAQPGEKDNFTELVERKAGKLAKDFIFRMTFTRSKGDHSLKLLANDKDLYKS